MRLAILQPHFLPFIGYFDLMARADLFVYYDTAQYVRRSWHHRTYICEAGKAILFSAPVDTQHGSRRPIKDMCWSDEFPWRRKLARRLSYIYADARNESLLGEIIELILQGPVSLSEWNIEANAIFARNLGIHTEILRASDIAAAQGSKQQKIVDLCKTLQATHYVCGPGSRFYIEDGYFASNGIMVDWVNYDYAEKLAVWNTQGEKVYPSVLDSIARFGTKAIQECLNDSGSTAL